MHKITVYLLAAVLLLTLVGCGSDNSASRQENFTFTYHEIPIVPGAEAAPVIQALGEPQSYTEEPSCAFDGMDKTYCYGGFYLTTFPMDGKDYVYSVWFADDSVATEEGIRIGSTQPEAEAVYGTDCFGGTNRYVQIKGGSRRMILLTDGLVSSVQYEVILG